jgi:hypothetical protein
VAIAQSLYAVGSALRALGRRAEAIETFRHCLRDAVERGMTSMAVRAIGELGGLAAESDRRGAVLMLLYAIDHKAIRSPDLERLRPLLEALSPVESELVAVRAELSSLTLADLAARALSS